MRQIVLNHAVMVSLLALSLGCGGGSQETNMDGSNSSVPLVPRDVLFGNADRQTVRLSSDGSYISWLAPKDGVMNVHVAPIDDLDAARAITNDTVRGIRIYFWAYTNDHVIYLQDKEGDENWRAYSVNIETMDETELTPYEGVRASIYAVEKDMPEHIVIGMNDRNPQLSDIYKVNVLTGERELIYQNDDGFAGFVVDSTYAVRLGTRFRADGGFDVLRIDEEGETKPYLSVANEDAMNTSTVAFNKAGDKLYMIDSRDRETSALFERDFESGEQRLIVEDSRADLSDMAFHPATREILAAAFTYERKEWKVLDESYNADFETLRGLNQGDPEIVSSTYNNETWIVAYLQDDGPVAYYLYNRPEKKGTFLFNNRDDLDGFTLSTMQPVVIKSRDNLDLVSYLTLPADAATDGRPAEPLPMILWVHGGPWARDNWGYNPYHQMFANRGYAVLSVNYRGSTGFGKSFVNAGNLEWARKMHDDLLDAVDWAVGEGIALQDKVCIGGGSYGGYATLVGLTMTPETFACGVDIVGPSSLVTLLENVPQYWIPILPQLTSRVGDLNTEEGRALLEERSPLNFVDQIQRPLLIAQGANDPRVKQLESDQIVQAMVNNNIPVTYVLYPDEGHGFARPENRLSFVAVTEHFLQEVLGGRAQDYEGAFEGSKITVPEGKSFVTGLAEALP